jgi:hypothetical protein
MDGLSYTTIIELAEPIAGRRGSALDRYAPAVNLVLSFTLCTNAFSLLEV